MIKNLSIGNPNNTHTKVDKKFVRNVEGSLDETKAIM